MTSTPPQKPVASTEPLASGTKSNSRTRRRRPRKLNRNEQSSGNVSDPSRDGVGGTAISTEISALKSRVEEIETKIKTLHQDRSEKKIPRRRMRREKSSLTDQNNEDEDETEQDEMSNLGTSLALAKRELAAKMLDSQQKSVSDKKPQSREQSRRRFSSADDDDIEEIPRRPEEMGSGTRTRSGLKRAVTISGSYRLPIPQSVTDGELNAVQQGLRSFQSIAKKYLDESKREPDEDLQRTKSGTGWSSWIGGYSMSVARVINNIKLEPPTSGETSSSRNERPPAATRSRSEPIGRKKPRKLRLRNNNDHEKTIAELEEGGGAGLLS